MLAYDERQSGMDIPLEPGRKVRLSSRLVGFDSPLLGERERHGWFRRWSTWAQERKDPWREDDSRLACTRS